MTGDITEWLIGRYLNGIRSDLAHTNYIIRVVKINSKPLIVTSDFRTDRINLEVNRGVIIKAYIG